MADALQFQDPIEFGVFQVDFRAGELRKRGVRIKLQEKPLQVLAMLLSQPGKVVTREELRRCIWPGESFGDFEHSINIAITKLRQALGDTAINPRFIETLPRPRSSPQAGQAPARLALFPVLDLSRTEGRRRSV